MSLIETIKCIILGIIQGILEPLPISSSGHLYIVGELLKTNVFDNLNFTIMTNTGSLIAIIILFKKDILDIIKDFFLFIKTKNKNYKINFFYGLWIIIGTIPAALIGFLFKDNIETIFQSTKFIGITLLITALFLFLVRNIKGKKNKENMTIKDSIIVGLFQAFALIPGISRSGSTLVGGMIMNLDRKIALKYSFMLYIPVSLAGFILGIKDMSGEANLDTSWLPYLLASLFSLIVTYIVAKWFINFVEKSKLEYFSYYCLLVGFLVIILF